MSLILPKNHAELWVSSFAKLSPYQPKLKNLLNEAEKKRCQSFSHKQSLEAFILSRSLLRLLGQSYLQIEAPQIQIEAGLLGKPYFARQQQLHFNISHSHGLIAFLFSPEVCGIDIECVGRKIDLSAILKRYFSATERQSWQNSSKNNETLGFFRGWTRKEAFLKATGEGISGLGKCEISFTPNMKQALLNRQNSTKETENWFFYDFLPEENFIGSIVIQARDLPIQRLDLEQIISEILT